MTIRPTEERELQKQIERAAARLYSTNDIEARIARALLEEGEFYENITAADLEIILRNIVYVMFAHQKVAGRDIDLLHNVPIMNVEIDGEQARVDFVVHIHKPIVVFIEFSYVLHNHPDDEKKNLCLDQSSLQIEEKTRRFDVKAKAALTALNLPKLARQEMSDMTAVIHNTLPEQLRKKGVSGQLKTIKLALNEHSLCVYLKGDFVPLTDEQ